MQWHNITNRCQSHQIKLAHKIGRRLVCCKPVCTPQISCSGNCGKKGKGSCANMMQPRGAVWPVRVDRCQNRGKGIFRFVMVQHNHIGFVCHLTQNICRSGAAIHTNQYGSALRHQIIQCGYVRAISFGHSVWNMGMNGAAEFFKKRGKNGGGAGTIHVIITKNPNYFTILDSFCHAGSSLIHIRESGRIGHKCPQLGFQKMRGLIRGNLAHGQQTANNFWNTQLLSQSSPQTHQGRIFCPGTPNPTPPTKAGFHP